MSSREQSFSLILSETLNSIGYSYDTIKASQNVATFIQSQLNGDFGDFGSKHSVHFFIAGSKKEGLSFFSPESDIDFMYILQEEKFSDRIRRQGNKLLIHDVPPGYALLKTTNSSGSHQAIAFLDLENCVPNIENLLSGEKIVNGPMMNTKIHSNPELLASVFGITDQAQLFTFRQTGPSMEFGFDLMQNMHRDTADLVISIPAECSFYTNLWIRRKRPHNNPTAERIHELSKLDAHVVPVACKGTDYAHYQWRVCYTMAEISLVQSFSATQYKVYVLLKMLSKEVIKNVCPDITSYVMKNVVFWVSELYPLEIFTENNIPSCLVFCLRFLKLCVRHQFLPNYMIPSRDLLFGKWEKRVVKRLSFLLVDLISERGMMVLRCGWVLSGMKLLLKFPFVRETMKHSATLGLFRKPVYFHGNADPQLDMGYVCSQILKVLEGIDRIIPFVEIIPKLNFYLMVIKIKKCVHTFITSDLGPHHVSDKIAVIKRIIVLEKKLVDSIVSFMCDLSRDFVYRMLKEVAPEMVLSDIGEGSKKKIASELERIGMLFITGTPEEQRYFMQKLTELI